jgi:LPXTG-site transpeptidase (sortase) family protein
MVIVTVVGVQFLRGTVARERARAEWTKVMKSSTISAVTSLGLGLTRVSSGTPVVRVIIPSIRLDEVVVEGLSDKDLWAGPGHMPGTVFPGQNGNSVISAHRDRHFHRLDDLRIGDMIETQTPAISVMWRITQRRVVGKDERAIFESQTPMLTLTTCWPTRYVGPAPDRLLLTAEPVSMRERETGPKAVAPDSMPVAVAP